MLEGRSGFHCLRSPGIGTALGTEYAVPGGDVCARGGDKDLKLEPPVKKLPNIPEKLGQQCSRTAALFARAKGRNNPPDEMGPHNGILFSAKKGTKH